MNASTAAIDSGVWPYLIAGLAIVVLFLVGNYLYGTDSRVGLNRKEKLAMYTTAAGLLALAAIMIFIEN